MILTPDFNNFNMDYADFCRTQFDLIASKYGITTSLDDNTDRNASMEPNSGGSWSADAIRQYYAEVDEIAKRYARFIELSPPKGIEVILSHYLDEKEYKQIRFPKSKRSRIRIKWAKNPKNWTTIIKSRVVFEGHNKICAGSVAFEEIKKSFTNRSNGESFKPILYMYVCGSNGPIQPISVKEVKIK